MKKVVLCVLLLLGVITNCVASDSDIFYAHFKKTENALMDKYVKSIPKKYGIKWIGINYGFSNDGIFDHFSLLVGVKMNIKSDPLPKFKMMSSELYRHFFTKYPNRIADIEILFQSACEFGCPYGFQIYYKTKSTLKLFNTGLLIEEYIFPALDPPWNHPPADSPY